jgi:hypothetical protein
MSQICYNKWHDRKFVFGCATNPWISPTISTRLVPKIKVSLKDQHVNMSERDGVLLSRSEAHGCGDGN